MYTKKVSRTVHYVQSIIASILLQDHVTYDEVADSYRYKDIVGITNIIKHLQGITPTDIAPTNKHDAFLSLRKKLVVNMKYRYKICFKKSAMYMCNVSLYDSINADSEHLLHSLDNMLTTRLSRSSSVIIEDMDIFPIVDLLLSLQAALDFSVLKNTLTYFMLIDESLEKCLSGQIH